MRRSLLVLVLLGVTAVPAVASEGIGRTDGIGSADGFFGRSQPSAPSGGESFAAPPNPPANAPPVPVDGGLALLAVAGAGYAAKRLRARRV